MPAGIKSRRNTATESGERFRFEISFPLPTIAYRLCVSGNVAHWFFAIAVWICKEFLAEIYRHFEVDRVLILVGVLFLYDNTGSNAADKVLHRHCCPYFLLYIVIVLAMKIHEI